MVRLPVLSESGRGGPVPSEPASGLQQALLAARCGEIRFGDHDRLLYATDASNYQVAPIGVVIPGSVDDAVRTVAICAQHNAAILPRGGGTSLAGQCTNEAVVIDFSAHVRTLLSVDVEAQRCTVEPGISIEELNDALRQDGLMFAPDPATARHANIGGCIGNNAAGARSIRYGRTSENLHAVDALLADGRRAWLREGAAAAPGAPEWLRELTQQVIEIVESLAREIRSRYPRTVRRNAGYSLDLILDQIERARAENRDPLETVNLASLVCGSEGTLAVTLGAELALRPLPRQKGLATIGFDTLEAAIEAVAPLLQTKPVAVELLDDVVLGVASANIEYRRYVDLMPRPGGRPPRAVLYVEYFSELSGAPGEREIAERLEAARAVVPGAATNIHTSADEMAQIWKLRKAGEPLLHGMAADRKPITFVEDNAVPVERLVEFVRRFKQIVARHQTVAAYWAHASVGVLHVRPALDLRDPEDERRMQEVAVEVADLARELGGVMSGEHGDGRVRSPLLERFYGTQIMEAFAQIKRLFDPAGLLNPGNIVPVGGVAGILPIESIAHRTRVRPTPGGPLVDTPETETYFDYTDQHGLRSAVEMCNGAGVCRKKSGGVMCPSYMGTLDERHSTRGRGNALRLAITGQGMAAGSGDGDRWNDPETLATLDLCLSCKACKSECPSNVDIARLKSEYLAQGFRQRGGAPLGAKLIGHVRTLNRLGAITPGLSNWLAGSALGRAALAKLIGLDARRSLPPLRRSLLRQWPASGRQSLAGAAHSGPTVALFADCFTTWNEPHIGLAARRLLEAFGYRVRLINAGCCARPMISSGLLDDACSTIDATAARLTAELGPDEPLLAIEPSCLSAIRDDWLQLKVATPLPERAALAVRARLVEQFLEEQWDHHPQRPDFAPVPQPITLHAHCHQRSLWTAESSAALLRRIFGDSLTVPDTTCCGMAGAFGYSRYDLSMKIGELSVLPAARSAGAMCATGTSCRHQIHDGAQISARHPVELLAEALTR
jgi:FAD/FMN-containing dehydrogenase/Fe-S oxidoreductase